MRAIHTVGVMVAIPHGKEPPSASKELPRSSQDFPRSLPGDSPGRSLPELPGSNNAPSKEPPLCPGWAHVNNYFHWELLGASAVHAQQQRQRQQAVAAAAAAAAVAAAAAAEAVSASAVAAAAVVVVDDVAVVVACCGCCRC